MPVSPNTDEGFSYEQNIAPYSNRFFNEIGADPNLRAADKVQLQGTLLSGVTDIALQREKLQQEQQQSALQRLSMQQMQGALEDSRLRRMRVAEAESADNDISRQINDVVYADAAPEDRHQALAELQLQHAGKMDDNPVLGHRFDAAFKAIPKPEKAQFTPDKLTDLYTKLAGHPQGAEIIGSGNPALIGLGLAQVAQLDEQHKAMADAAKADTVEARRLRHGLLTVDPKFVADEATGEELWLEPGVHNQFKLLMDLSGTPEEQKAFNAEKDDRKRAAMAQAVQLRALRAAVGKPQDEAASPKARASALVR